MRWRVQRKAAATASSSWTSSWAGVAGTARPADAAHAPERRLPAQAQRHLPHVELLQATSNAKNKFDALFGACNGGSKWRRTCRRTTSRTLACRRKPTSSSWIAKGAKRGSPPWATRSGRDHHHQDLDQETTGTVLLSSGQCKAMYAELCAAPLASHLCLVAHAEAIEFTQVTDAPQTW